MLYTIPKIEKLGFIVDYKSPEELRKIMAEDYPAASVIVLELVYGNKCAWSDLQHPKG